MNVALAVGLLTGLFMVKYQKVSDADMQAIIGHVMPDSPAAKAGIQDGDRIVKLGAKENPTWEDVGLKEVESAYQPMYLTIERNGKRFDTTVTPTMGERSGLGYAGWDERGEVQLGEITPHLPADKAGLKKGDLLIAVNGQPIHSLFKFQEITQNSGGKPVEIEFERNREKRHITVRPVFASIDGPERWMIGVMPQQKLNLITTRLSFPDAFRESVRQNAKGAMLIAQFLKGVVERRMSAEEPHRADRHCPTLRRSGPRRPLGIHHPDVDGQPQPRHFQPAAHPDSRRRRHFDAVRRNGHATGPQPQREGSRVQGRFCRHYGDCGLRHLQRHLANPAGGMKNA